MNQVVVDDVGFKKKRIAEDRKGKRIMKRMSSVSFLDFIDHIIAGLPAVKAIPYDIGVAIIRAFGSHQLIGNDAPLAQIAMQIMSVEPIADEVVVANLKVFHASTPMNQFSDDPINSSKYYFSESNVSCFIKALRPLYVTRPRFTHPCMSRTWV